MQGLDYTRTNNLLGWAMGLIALVVYALTVEPTASYWDCSEFIAVAYKLEVPHPPGAPLYLMLGRLFSLLAVGDLTQVAYWVNMLSVLSSALTIVFLFWTITNLGGRIVGTATPTGLSRYGVFGAGVLGASCFMFSDSFWFSATEAEVYALSSLFTAVIIWAILRWERTTSKQLQWRWIILISYLLGLSIGVHLLGLITLPAIFLLIYFKQYVGRITYFGAIIAMLLGVLAVGIIMLGVIQGMPSIASGFDIFFVNYLGLPFYSGVVCFLVLFFGSLFFGIFQTARKQWVVSNTLLLSLLFILVGYSSYLLVLIRSNDNPPIDENNPEDIVKFISYLKREQYGDRPLIYGQHFASRLVDQQRSKPIYKKSESEYKIVDWAIKPVFDPSAMILFPRMASQSQRHKAAYRRYLGLGKDEAPSPLDNLRFFFGYQIGHMYARYFMWNFAGRESDIYDASWLSPIQALEKNTPSELATNKKRNNYWMLPFLLGLLGLVFQGTRDYQGFSFVALIFLLMGVGIVFYLNMPPNEPRERDYIYTGSYYAFAIWIGLAFLALENGMRRWFTSGKLRLLLTSIIALLPIALMAKENWDDQDRSERYFSVASAHNLLESCAPNSILFTGGDNDTFPLWYAQEVEEIRTDVRVIVLSYFNTDWYIEQMMRPAYKSASLPFTLGITHYTQGGLNDLLYVYPNKDIKGAISLQRYLSLVRTTDKRIQLEARSGIRYNMVPGKDLILEIDTARVRAANILSPAFDSLLTDKIHIRLSGNYIEKKDLAILDLLSAQDWSRPIYFNHTSLRGIGMDMEPYVVQEGLTYRFLPILNRATEVNQKNLQSAPLIDTARMYAHLMQDFSFRGLQNEDVYLSGDYKNFVYSHRGAFSTLASSLYLQGDTVRAREVLRYSLDRMPDEVIAYDGYNLPTVAIALAVGEVDMARTLADNITRRAKEWLVYTSKPSRIGRHVNTIRRISNLFLTHGYKEEAEKYIQLLE